ncbi:MAG: hypothetical protein ACYDH9_02810 [Limisphaerales bacterium]
MITTTGSSNLNGQPLATLLGVFSGDTSSNLNVVTNVASFSSFVPTSRAIFQAVAGLQYQILVDQDRYGPPGTVRLNLNLVAPPVFLPGSALLLSNGRFSARLKGVPEQPYLLEVTTNLVIQRGADLTVWTPLTTNSLNLDGIWDFSDPEASGSIRRFYRVREAP